MSLVDLLFGRRLNTLDFRKRPLFLCLQSLPELFYSGLIPCLSINTRDSLPYQCRDIATDIAGSFLYFIPSLFIYLFFLYSHWLKSRYIKSSFFYLIFFILREHLISQKMGKLKKTLQ